MTIEKSIHKRVTDMLEAGYNTKAIVAQLGVKPQIVYNARYYLNKKKGLGAIGKTVPNPVDGIGTPPKPKRKYTRRVKAGTGINGHALPAPASPIVVQMEEPKEPVWKQRFKHLLRAFGWKG